MWSDRESELDLLNVQHLVAAVQTTATSEHLLPVTVGVFGDWGSGKSTVLRLARMGLQDDADVLCVHFNGWLFEGYEDAKAAILGTILDELADRRGAREKAGDLLDKLLRKVSWLRLAGWGGKALMVAQGLPPELTMVSGLMETAPAILQDVTAKAPEGEQNIRRGIRDFEDEFRAVLKKTGVRAVVVFIDDLDRCLPTTIIDTLEAIRLFVFVPGTAFVIAADERLVRRAVRQHFRGFEEVQDAGPNYPSRDVGREYLEKLIQVPVYVPPLSRTEIATYVNMLFAQRHLEEGPFTKLCERVRERMTGSIGADVAFSIASAEECLGEIPEGEFAADLSLGSQLGDVLSASVHGNPRQTKRFLNALMLRFRMAESRGVNLERRITAKLLLLEYFKPTLFRSLAMAQAAQGGVPAEIRELQAWIRRQELPVMASADAEARDPATANDSGLAEEREKKEAADEPDLPQELRHWVSEEWVRSWLTLEPPLDGINLAPYFFFARERTGPVGQLAAQLSPEATTALQQLLAPSEASHRAAMRAATDFSTTDASGVFEALLRHTSTNEGMERPHSALAGLLRLVTVRPELQGQLAAFVGALPIASVGPWAAALLARAIPDAEHQVALKEIFARWRAAKGPLRKATEIVESRRREAE